ncbi:hypothetical protein ACHAXT_001795 [Thalassiosira profunda]
MKLIETVVNAVTSSMRSQRLRKGGAAEDEPAEAAAAEKSEKEEAAAEEKPDEAEKPEAAKAKDDADAANEALKEEEKKLASLNEKSGDGADAKPAADSAKKSPKKDDAPSGFKSQYDYEMARRSGLMGGGPGPGMGYPGMGYPGMPGMDPQMMMYNPYLRDPYMASMPLPTPNQLRGYMAGGPLPTPHEVKNAGANVKNFPEALFDVVNTQRFNHIVAWLPHGKGFVIHEKQLFAKTILPAYFDGAKFTSFTRRLKRWRFERVPRGPELGAYYNKYFVRDRPDLVKKMQYHPSDEPTEKDLAEAAAKGEGKSDAKDAGDKKEGGSAKKKGSRKRKPNAYPNDAPAPKIPSPDMGPPSYPPGMGGYGMPGGFPPMGGMGGMGGFERIAMERGMGGFPGGMPGGPPGMGGYGMPPAAGGAPGAPVVSSPLDLKAKELERQRRVLEAERVLAEEKGGGAAGGTTPGGSQRPVMMSPTEEREFADYLAAKRGAFPGP